MTSDGSVNVSALLEEDPEMRLDDLPETGVGGDGDGDASGSGGTGTGATETDAETTTAARARLTERLRKAGLSTRRFIDVADGQKKSTNHNQRAPDDPRLSGNYGVYAGRGAGGEKDDTAPWLVDMDVDDYATDADGGTDALDAVLDLPATLTTETPHTDGETGEHRFYAVTGDVVAAMQDVAGASNPSPSWGEVRVTNQYVVGPGSQIDGCDKEWCDECATNDGGRYRIADDRPIASITAQDLADVLRADPNYSTAASGRDSGDTADYIADGTDVEDVARENPWLRDYLAFGDEDRSEADYRACCVMIESGVTETDARALLAGSPHTKVGDRGPDYWRRTWQSALREADRPAESADNENGLPSPATDDGRGEWSDLPYRGDKGGVQTRPTRLAVAELLIEEHEFVTPHPEGNDVTRTPLYRYLPDEGYFASDGAAWVSERIAERVPELESADVSEVINRVKRLSYIDRDTFGAGEHDHTLVNLANGVYDVNTGEVVEHSADYRFTTVVPRTFDPDAECPNIERFVREIVPGEKERQTLYEWAGYCLENGYPIHRLLIIYGNGRNGKSRFFELLTEFLSPENVSGVTLETISSGGFGVSALADSKLNVDSESADTRLSSSELNTLKALSGGDSRQVDVKYEEPFEMTNAAKLAFAANEPPRFDEDTDAIADRLLAVELPYRFGHDANADKPATPQKELMDRLTTETELSGFLNKALEALGRVRDRGYFSLEEGATARERFEVYQAGADSILGFSRACLKNESRFALPKSAVYSMYRAYCVANSHTPAEESAFFRQLGRKGDIETYSKRPRIASPDLPENYRPRVLDRLWITTDGLSYLSPPARDEIMPIINHMHSGKANYAHDLLIRADKGPDTAPDAEPEPIGEPPSQAERIDLAREAIQDLCETDNGTEYARAGDIENKLMDEGVSTDAVREVLEKLQRQGVVYEPATGEYALR